MDVPFEESLKWTKEFDPTRLTTYESAFYQSTDREYDYSNIDVVEECTQLFLRLMNTWKRIRISLFFW